jgi:hypothetical protein
METHTAFRDYIPTEEWHLKKPLAELNARQWAKLRSEDPFMVDWMAKWQQSYNSPYQGITTDGEVRTGIYRLPEDHEDFGAPTTAMVAAAEAILSATNPTERKALCYPIDAPEWRRWMNPEIYLFENGLRLEQVSEELVTEIHQLLRASLSAEGYAKAAGCMKLNDFLGTVVDGSKVLNGLAYNFALFGTPHLTMPWGWHLYGHHLCLNCFVVGTQLVISPIFMGAEPNIIDEGPHQGLTLFTSQENAGLTLMQSLEEPFRSEARIFASVNDPAMPEWRYHRADQRHLGGAFQDNRVVPYEGSLVSHWPQAAQDMALDTICKSLDYLPTGAFEARIDEVKRYWVETYFCWIGGNLQGDAFYYKIHSPVIMQEFDHHTGVFLTNKEPLPFHIHTLVRTPNGNDYGKALLHLYKEKHKDGIVT